MNKSAVLIIFSFLLLFTKQQTNLVWSLPSSDIDCTQLNLVINSNGVSYKLTNATYSKAFSSTPYIALGLKSLKEVSRTVQIFQNARTITPTMFVHELFLVDPHNVIQLIKINYLAVVLNHYVNCFNPHQMKISLSSLNTNNPVSDTQFIQISYINMFSAGDNQIGVFLTGFDIIAENPIYIRLGVQFYDKLSYILGVTFRNGILNKLQFTRFLIDRQIEASQPYGIYRFAISNLQITHQTSGPSIKYFATPLVSNFFQRSHFYGIIQFNDSFECLTNNSILNPPSPRAHLKIVSVSFFELLCPSNLAYENTTKTCYSKSSPRLYPIDLIQYGFCYGPCFKCTGPNKADCLQFSQIEAQISGGDLVCRYGYGVHPQTKHCRACFMLHQGCETCDGTGGCTSCHVNCRFINSSYCDCSVFCNGPYQFISPHTGVCQCIPQYYRTNNGTCQKCAKGCYICNSSPTTCSVCIDGYELVHGSCSIYKHSTFLLDSNPGSISPNTRCIQTVMGSCVLYCSQQSYMYQSICYTFQCPSGTFQFVDVNSNSSMCQPCPDSCIDCDNWIVCKKCLQKKYVLNGTGYCQRCPTACQQCDRFKLCEICEQGYSLSSDNRTCQLLIPPAPLSCGFGCSQCVLEQYCQKCLPGYYRSSNLKDCVMCIGEGFSQIKYQIVSGYAIGQCKQICGDGILIIDQCDDGNSQSGDGCSSQCMIQDGYQCEYLQIQKTSYCINGSSKIYCSYDKFLNENKLNVTVHTTGPFKLDYSYQCQNSMNKLQIVKQKSNTTYVFQYQEAIENVTCVFRISESILLNPLSCNISSRPLALNQFPSSNQFYESIVNISNNSLYIICYAILILSAIGIDPFDSLINNVFIYLYLSSLYGYYQQPSNVYGIFEQLKVFSYFIADHSKAEDLMTDGELLLQPCIYILVFCGAILLGRQIILRLMLFLCKGNKFSKVFQKLFHYRLIFFASLYTSFEPIIVIYIASILYSSPLEIKGYVIVAFHSLAIILTYVFMIVHFKRYFECPAHSKFFFFTLLIKVISLIGPYYLVFKNDIVFIAQYFQAFAFIIYFFYSIFDGSAQQYVQENKLHTFQVIAQENDGRTNRSVIAKKAIRKINIGSHTLLFIAIITIRIYYLQISNYNNSSAELSWTGRMITSIFILGTIAFCSLINILSQITTVFVYYNSNVIQANINLNESQSRLNNDSQILNAANQLSQRSN